MRDIVLFLFIAMSYLPSVLGLCGDSKDCFNCSISTDSCQWDPVAKCTSLANQGTYNPFYLQFSNCIDAESSKIQEKFCGPMELGIIKENYKLTLPKVDGKYATPNLYCKYVFLNDDKKKNYLINLQKSTESKDKTKILIEAVFFDGNQQSLNVTNPDVVVGVENAQEVSIHYYVSKQFGEIPFGFVLSPIKKGVSVTLIVTIVLVVAACIICSVSIFIFSKRMAARNAQRNLMGRMPNGQIQMQIGLPGESQEELKKRKTLQLETMFESTMQSRDFNEDLGKFNINCTICLEEFDKLSKVCLTPCNHVFHYDCIKIWLLKNLLNSKCPNCNFLLLPDPNNTAVNQNIPLNPANVQVSTFRNNPNVVGENAQYNSINPNNLPQHVNINPVNNSPNVVGQNTGYNNINPNNLPQHVNINPVNNS